MYSKMTRIILTFFIITILMSGCNSVSGSKPASGDDKFTIVTSFYPIYLHAINIANGLQGVSVVNMTEAQSGCLHDYNLNTGDMKTLSNAQVFVISGAGTESFMSKVVKQLPDLRVIDASEGIELIEGEEHEGDGVKENEEEHDEEGNPHVWVSISNAIQQVKNIGRKLAEIDPDNADGYKSNTDAYIKRLEAQKDKMHKALDSIKNKDIVTFHEAFPYFAKEFNLNILAVIESEPGSEPSAKELKATIETIKQHNIKALFAEPQYSSKAAETIAKETGAKIFILDPVVTGEANGDTDAYIRIMDNNLKVLQEALK